MTSAWKILSVLFVVAMAVTAAAADPLLTDCDEGGEDCAAACSPFPATGQDRQVVAGEDGNPAFGATLSFVDNGDGTVTDGNTGLVWEKKSDEGGRNDVHGIFTWSAAFTIFLPTLNGRCAIDATQVCTTDGDCPAGECGFAGYQDWRIPNVKELFSITDLGATNPAVSSAFQDACPIGCPAISCSCTSPGNYWTSTTVTGNTAEAWTVQFEHGVLFRREKTESAQVRAVRGGALAGP